MAQANTESLPSGSLRLTQTAGLLMVYEMKQFESAKFVDCLWTLSQILCPEFQPETIDGKLAKSSITGPKLIFLV